MTGNRHEFPSLKALLAAEGIELGPTPWWTITQEEVNSFAGLTHDQQWIHVDPARAASGPFGTTVVHGFFTLALCSRVLDELQTTQGVAHAVNYGLDKVRFPAPLSVGAPVRGRLCLDRVQARSGYVDAVWRVTLETPGSDRPVCVAAMVSRYYEGM